MEKSTPWANWQPCPFKTADAALRRITDEIPQFFLGTSIKSARCTALPFYKSHQLLELELREPAHLVLGERDVVAQLAVQRLGRGGDLVVADDERRRVPGVEALRVAAHRRLALAFDVGQDLRDGVADLLRCGRGLRRCLLHDLAHQATPWSAR